MSEEVSSREIRAFCDGELDVDEGAALQSRVRDDADLAARVRFEQTLRNRVGFVMTDETPSAPAELKGLVAARLAEARIEAEAKADTGTETETETVTDADDGTGTGTGADDGNGSSNGERRSWLTGPTRANTFAVVAVLLLIASAILVGIFGQPIDSIRAERGSDLVAEAALFVSAEHIRCASKLQNRDQKIVWRSPAEAGNGLSRHFGAAVPILDLEEFGYRFIGASSCDLPGQAMSAHLIYSLDERGDDGCPQATMSLFVVPDLGQFDRTLGRKLGVWEWVRAGEPPDCSKRVACSTDGKFFYFLVCCNERNLVAMADRIRRAAP